MNNIQGIRNRPEEVKRITFLIAGWLSAIISLFYYPFIFGMVGVISGILSTKDHRSRLGVYLVVSSIVLMGLGLAFSSHLLFAVKTLAGDMK